MMSGRNGRPWMAENDLASWVLSNHELVGNGAIPFEGGGGHETVVDELDQRARWVMSREQKPDIPSGGRAHHAEPAHWGHALHDLTLVGRA